MTKPVTRCVLILVVLLAVSAVFSASGEIYTNEDLEKYTDKKGDQAPVPPVQYTGRKVTLNFTEASLVGVLTVLSDIARRDGYTVTVDQQIRGRITLKVTSVSWDQVLDFLVETHGLVKTVKGKSIQLSPPK
jgi:type II secretory pathway component HofQ